eukprot:maker-scaffold_1-snap-gene-29.50-mRNA-1 protein AED:0.20 eAED:0.20 QI:370/1/1/1/1/1/2/70/227
MTLKLYGTPLSQPFRSVRWLLEIKEFPFEFVPTMPGSRKVKGSRSPDFLKLNPNGAVPVIDDDGFILWESNAILTYLCEKNGWTDFYPADPEGKGLVQQWLNWHHQNSRIFTLAFFAPLFRPDIKFPESTVKMNKKTTTKAASMLNDALEGKSYLVGDCPTIADLAIFSDLNQLHESELGLYDFSGYKNIESWFERMRKLDKYHLCHKDLKKMMPLVEQAKNKMPKL